MTTEQNQPQATSHEAASSAEQPQGQPSQGQTPQGQPRSRRRKRKRKGGKPGTPAATQAGVQQSTQPAPQGQAQSPKQNGKRFFKKFRGKGGSQSNASPGNNPGNGQGGARRKSKPRRQQAFVGPMDHSYRAANGNFAEAPPSTIEIHGNMQGNGYGGNGYSGNGNGNSASYQPEPLPAQAATKAREDAPTRIFCFVDDLFFQAKIQETARKLGVKVAFTKAEKDTVAQLCKAETLPTLIVFDLNNANAKPLTLIPKLKAKLKRATSIVGFLSHLQGDLKMKATEAGCDTVMPRSAFSQNLPNLLRRYGLEDEPEVMEA
ncbi:MAG: response regulator [Acidobacteriaceae bacterium]